MRNLEKKHALSTRADSPLDKQATLQKVVHSIEEAGGMGNFPNHWCASTSPCIFETFNTNDRSEKEAEQTDWKLHLRR